MKKKIATRNFIFISVILVIAMVFTIFKLPIAFSDYIFNGFARSFNLGLEFGGGVSATFDVEKADYYTKDESTINTNAQDIIQKLVLDKYHDGKVELVGENQIKITVPGDSIASGIILGELEMKAASGEETETLVNGSHIKEASYMMNGTNHGVYIEFNKEGKTAFEKLTETAAGNGETVYIYLNHDYDNGRQVSGITEAMSDGVCYITLNSKDDAQNYAQQLNNSKYGINLTIDSEAESIHPTFNTYQKVMCVVGVLLVIIAIAVFFILKFKALGWIMTLAMLIYAVLNIITLSLIPAFLLTIGSYLALLLGYIITAVAIYLVVDKSKQEYYNGKKLPVSFKSGYKKSLLANVDIYSITGIIGLLLIILGKGNSYNIGLGLFVGTLIGALVGLLLIRGFMIMYLHINPSKGNKINFVKGENIDEVK